ncbi:hypothetical protein [Desulfonema magnum]|uniref:HD/PDEase domain-containing protein n=1 Tax=Desulfonema magnum TaxID=45655 RepID=A0A975BTM1_9BACT|nr:hypothetical protein [Desulfonema magnum]QTA91388.1 Uncharacterized protein dnm_074550 [Desulfonema magnum]
MDDKDIYCILQIDCPEDVLKEVRIICSMISSEFDFAPVETVFMTVLRLFNGTYPGYRACNTKYHDLRHTTDVFLAMARMIHGGVIDNMTFSYRHVMLGLISALFHDTGYIQENHDTEGTGAKYTSTHVQRSMDFIKRHGTEHGLSYDEIVEGQAMILCTNPFVDISGITFPSEEVESLGKMLAVADFLAQMSDRIYLEKLLYLYHEFKEGKVPGYKSEVELLQKTICFYEFTENRIQSLSEEVDRLLRLHFASRWNVNENLYDIAKEKQKAYLHKILKHPDPLKFLKRGGVVEDIFG